MLGMINRRYEALVWDADLEQMRGPRRWLLIAIRIVPALVHDFQAGEITMRAMGLVYTTLVSLVPLLALAFSLLKAFGVDNALRPVLVRFLSPLGAGSGQIVDKIVDFVQNVQVGVLGAIGVVALLWSVISLIQKVEDGCNYIWRVRHARSIGRRVTEYLSVLVAGPLVILAAISLTASLSSNTVVEHLRSIEPFGATLYLIGRLIPYLLYSIAFTLLFAFIPNTRVRWLPALGGGVFAGVLWQTASLGFTLFASNAGNVNAIYSSFAIVILMLIWMYVSWMILLMGCRVAFLLQHPERLTKASYPPELGADRREQLALLVTGLIGRNFINGSPPWQAYRLAHYLRVAPDHVYDLVDHLVAQNLLIETGTDAVTLMPRRDIETVTVNEILDVVRRGDPAAGPRPRDDGPHRAVERWLVASEKTRHELFGKLTLRELAMSMSNNQSDSRASASSIEPVKPTNISKARRARR